MILKLVFFLQYEYMMPWQYVGPIRPHQNKRLANIVGIRIVGGKTHSSPWLALSNMTYSNVVSVPVEKYRYVWYTSPLIPQVMSVCLTLHEQCCIHYENIFTSCRWRPQDIPRSPCPRCVVVASHTIDAQPLPHDRDGSHASLVLRERVQDSHHPTGGNLTSYLHVNYRK
jgi:hypothetical protein